ncbi:MarC family protein [Erythrobacter sp. T5W1-R]|uniref:MarC family protein n=1 Tax=Erythrobacter sp. T5W1-R TaxID=3101752 RepID=UPI002AFF047D|nr:MarC family protein [Erythrobacter sp. T5W1-R]MEA1618355.1 MarC family protein [Erythrobacter sp. T5W1-R]
MDAATLVLQFVTLLVVVDPIGTLPVFYHATAQVPPEHHRSFAVRGVVVATIVLLFFLAAGQVLLETLGLRFGSFKIAGGIVLFLFAMTMIFGHSKAEDEIDEAENDPLAGAVFPLAMPSIASPGAMLAVVVLTNNQSSSFTDQLVTAGLLLAVMAITLIFLLLAARLKSVLGSTGANVISRVMGIVLATIAVDAVLNGLEAVGMVTLPDAL